MKLSKRVPSKIVTFEASQCALDWMEMTPRFREIRSKCRDPLDKCHWCKHPFADGEMMSLAIANRGNKSLCRSCAEELIASTVQAEETNP